jgi:hypothetical protein
MAIARSFRVIAGVFLLTALFIGCALAQENATPGSEHPIIPVPENTLQPPEIVNIPALDLIPKPAIPLIAELAKQKSWTPVPLKYATSDDPTQQSSFNSYAKYDFVYRGTTYYIWVPYNIAAYESAKINYPARTEDRQRELAGLTTLMPNTWWTTLPTMKNWIWWDSQMMDPAQDEMYDSIVFQLTNISDQLKLDDNERAELIARFVQRTVPNVHQPLVERYPIETIAERGGGQKDKAMLLNQLFCHAGYGAAIIYFPLTNAFVVGIPGDHKAVEYDGWIAIDPGTETFFGWDDARAAYTSQALGGGKSGGLWASSFVAQQCRGKGYTAGNQVRIIQDNVLLDALNPDKENYQNDLHIIRANRDNRQLVFNYVTESGPFRYTSY